MALYHPGIFDVETVEAAKAIILTPEPGTDTAERWALETPYVLELMAQSFQAGPAMVVLDYGCGIGRIAKVLIETTGCSVIGVDISDSMRRMAIDYVGSPRFIAVSPQQLDMMTGAGCGSGPRLRCGFCSTASPRPTTSPACSARWRRTGAHSS